MIIRTSQDVALVGCNDCLPPSAPAPRQEDRVPCGYVIGAGAFDHYNNYQWSTTGAPAVEFVGKTYRKVTVVRSATYLGGTGGATYNRIYTKEIDEEEGHCATLTVTGIATWDYGFSVDYSPDGPPEGDYWVSYSSSGTYLTLTTGSGTQTYVFSESDSATSSAGLVDMTFSGSPSDAWAGNVFTSTYENGTIVFTYEEEDAGAYRIGIPSGTTWDATTGAWKSWEAGGSVGEEPEKTTFDVAHAAWVIEHAEWMAIDPEERGEEPLAPIKRTYYEWQGDEYFFSAEYDAWRILQDAFDLATLEHEAWEADETEPKPDEPDVPEDPGEAPSPAPELLTSRSWIYSGADEWSEWFDLSIPEEIIEGETRLVNQMAKHYRSTRFGVKATAFGEVYVPG